MSNRVNRQELMRRYERRMELLVPAPIEDLRPLPLFSGVPEKARDKVIEKARKYLHLVDFAAGEYVLREGDYTDSAYFIIDGVVEVLGSGQDPQSKTARPSVRGGAHQAPIAQRPGARPEAGG